MAEGAAVAGHRALLQNSALQQPWMTPYREQAATAQVALVRGASVAQALALCSRQASFVEASQQTRSEDYESFIARTGCIAVRNDLHDFFNGLVWLTFPLAKRHLNALHAERISADGVQATRGALRDAITVFDENGALLLNAPELLLRALAGRDWRRLFVELRALWDEVDLVLFGHALLEKLVNPRKAICAHVLPLAGAPQKLDSALAAALDPDMLAAKPFLPLPVLGVPGWWPANADPAFYDDAAVFRSRTAKAGGPTGASS